MIEHHFHYAGWEEGLGGQPCHRPLNNDPYDKLACPKPLLSGMVQECHCYDERESTP